MNDSKITVHILKKSSLLIYQNAALMITYQNISIFNNTPWQGFFLYSSKTYL
jgi:hypothetical protein